MLRENQEMKVEFNGPTIKNGYGSQYVEYSHTVKISNDQYWNEYQVLSVLRGLESGDIRLSVGDVILPEETNEDTLTIDAVRELFNDYFDN